MVLSCTDARRRLALRDPVAEAGATIKPEDMQAAAEKVPEITKLRVEYTRKATEVKKLYDPDFFEGKGKYLDARSKKIFHDMRQIIDRAAEVLSDPVSLAACCDYGIWISPVRETFVRHFDPALMMPRLAAALDNLRAIDDAREAEARKAEQIKFPLPHPGYETQFRDMSSGVIFSKMEVDA